MNMLVADVMSVRLFCARPETPIKEVARRLVRNRIGGMPVVDDEGQIKGMVTESDLQPARKTTDQPVRTAADVMTQPVIGLSEVDTVAEAARVLSRHHIKRAPVLREGRVVGIVTKSDLLRPYLRSDGEIRADVEELLFDGMGLTTEHLGVTVDEGVVLLEGSVHSREQATLCRHLARGVDGVVDAIDRLHVVDDEGKTGGLELVRGFDPLGAGAGR